MGSENDIDKKLPPRLIYSDASNSGCEVASENSKTGDIYSFGKLIPYKCKRTFSSKICVKYVCRYWKT